MVSFPKITQSLCLLAIMATANAGSLRGDSSCTQLQCINGEGGDAACKASNTCVSDSKVLGANDKGCWTAYNEGSITAGEGFTGELRTVLCVKGIDSKIVPKIAVTEGAKVSKVTMNGGEGTAGEGSSIVAIETNGGSFKGTTTGVETVKTNGGSITINAAASAVNAATSNGGRITLSAASVAKVTTNGGSIVVTATSVKSVETNGGSITINKAHVESVETNGGSVNLTQGAAATKYSKSGGSCTGCPKADDDKRTSSSTNPTAAGENCAAWCSTTPQASWQYIGQCKACSKRQ